MVHNDCFFFVFVCLFDFVLLLMLKFYPIMFRV